jgi:hypothetical protein
LVHGLGFEPCAMLAFTLAIDFEGDQWTFFKPPTPTSTTSTASTCRSWRIWRPLADHVAEQVAAGRPVLVELDSFYLPDTSGTAYRIARTKSTVGVNDIDIAARRMGYFHNAGYYEVEGDDFRDALQLDGARTSACCRLRRVREVARAGFEAPRGAALVEASLPLLRRHLGRVPRANPFTRFRERFAADLDWLMSGDIGRFHAYSFATLRQYGACFELAETYLRWLTAGGVPGWRSRRRPSTASRRRRSRCSSSSRARSRARSRSTCRRSTRWRPTGRRRSAGAPEPRGLTARRTLGEGWQLARTPPGTVPSPEGLAAANPDGTPPWCRARSPRRWAMTSTFRDYDAHDWWYRTSFEAVPASAATREYLAFDGLATLAQVWLNGREILVARNMFRRYRVEVTGALAAKNDLVIRFASLDAALTQRRPRPRWKTALVRQQNLRWFRTTFLGRMPGWAPAVPTVGPWRAVTLEREAPFDVRSVQLLPRAEGARGNCECMRPSHRTRAMRSRRRAFASAPPRARSMYVPGAMACTWKARRSIADVPLWWPHTHGEPRLVDCVLEIRVAGAWRSHDCGRVGFRSICAGPAAGARCASS